MLKGKKVLLGISGGIAAYKGPALVRALVKEGAEVRVVLTDSAARFVSPLSLQVVSGHPIARDLFDPTLEAEIGHIELARWPDVILVAPATANLLGRITHGLCDDLLTTLLCATTAPVALAPAMNTQMWLNPAVQANVQTLREREGYLVIAPDQGELACKEVGTGRMPDPPALLEGALRALTPPLLKGKRVVISAGPTREFIDPVRFITNPSSGKMGFALARAAARMGGEVKLVTGPSHQATPPGVERINISSADDMFEAFDSLVMAPSRAGRRGADFAIKAAAVADWKPSEPNDQKTKKRPGGWSIPLTRTRDILAALGTLPDATRPRLIGFAAETQDLEENALGKLARKNLDWIVANSVRTGNSAFAADQSSVILFNRQGEKEELGPASKIDVASMIWHRVLQS